MSAFQLSYDYRCPFASNLHRHVIVALRAGADFDVTFVPWTMSQGYRAEGAPDVWDDPARDGEHLALAASVSVRDLQPQHFLDVHEALFLARHRDGQRLTTDAVVGDVLATTDVDVAAVFDDVATRRPHRVIGESFLEFEKYEAFGVPTFVVDGDATFVRYMEPPTGDAAASTTLITTLAGLMTTTSALNEFKHTQVPY